MIFLTQDWFVSIQKWPHKHTQKLIFACLSHRKYILPEWLICVKIRLMINLVGLIRSPRLRATIHQNETVSSPILRSSSAQNTISSHESGQLHSLQSSPSTDALQLPRVNRFRSDHSQEVNTPTYAHRTVLIRYQSSFDQNVGFGIVLSPSTSTTPSPSSPISVRRLAWCHSSEIMAIRTGCMTMHLPCS